MTAGGRVQQALYSKLKDLNIKFEEFTHAAANTADDVAVIFCNKPYQQVKNLFLYDKKKKFYLVAAKTESNVSLKSLSMLLNAPNPRFANEEHMLSMLGVTPGSVTPLAIMNDLKKEVTLILDEALKASDNPLLVHPMHNEASIAISLADLIKFVASCNREILWLDVTAAPRTSEAISSPSLSTAAPAAAIQKSTGGTEMLGITVKKSENFAEWYTQVITRAEMVEYYDISGCYILRPWSYFMWESIQEFVNKELRKLDVQNCYFPMFVSRQKLETEKDHIEGFSPEVAWVTKYGTSDLAEPIAIRPTSETIMYPAYAKWIRSHRDLPLKLNQWCQVVRWEFKQPTPFIRTREFLWQEGHTAHSTDEEAMETVLEVLDIYEKVYHDLLAVPVIKGFKSDLEKFAGGKLTTTVETLIPGNGRAVQAATSHHLGQNFSKMFKIEFEDSDLQQKSVHQTSWAVTTRSLGIAVMVHGDDKGMVMPPRVAPIQVVIVPIRYKESESSELMNRCSKFAKDFARNGIRVKLDDRDIYTPGWKYNHWEKKGVCVRMEVGPDDMKNGTARLVRRDNGEKVVCKWEELETRIPEMLNSIHDYLYKKAKDNLDSSIVKIHSFDQVMPALNNRKLVFAPWCEDPETEGFIKTETTKLSAEMQQQRQRQKVNLLNPAEAGTAEPATEAGCGGSDATSTLTGAMKPLCIPLEQPEMPVGTECFFSKGKLAKRWCLFGRSY